MPVTARKLATYLFAGMLLITTASLPGVANAGTHEEEYVDTPGSGEMIIDAVVVRPIMLVGTVIGVVLFVVTLPFSALGGNVGEAADKLVVEPAAYTFVRPLGEM
jgi:hypothetical protein